MKQDPIIYSGNVDEDDKIVGQLYSRRQVMKMAGAAGLVLVSNGGTFSAARAASLARAAQGVSRDAVNIVASPSATEGPFFVDEKLLRSDIVSAGSSRSTVNGGLRLNLTLNIYELSGSLGYPLSGVYVDLWHCDTIGAYSDVNNGGIQSENTVGQTWLRGYQVSDANGQVTFQTIFPGWYIGRTIHFHFKCRRYNASNQKTYEFTSQLFFSETLNNAVLANSIYSHGTRQVFNSNDGIYQAQQNGVAIGDVLQIGMTKSILTDASSGTVANPMTGNFSIAFDSEQDSFVSDWLKY